MCASPRGVPERLIQTYLVIKRYEKCTVTLRLGFGLGRGAGVRDGSFLVVRCPGVDNCRTLAISA